MIGPIEVGWGENVTYGSKTHGLTDATRAQDLLTGAYAKARKVHLVLDNLNIHFKKCFDDVLGKREAARLLRRVQFHYTPKHASWLNMAEIEIGILTRQCLDRRIACREFPLCEARSMPGSKIETPSNAPSSGSSSDRMRIRSWGAITFRNLRAETTSSHGR